MGDLVNVFSWSMSRAEKFRTCPRAYYFHYYGSWGGWERGASSRTRELWLFKKLTSRKAWAGTAVHETIAWALGEAAGKGELPSLERASALMRDRMRREFTDSRSGTWRIRRALGLLEHAYSEDVSDEEWLDNWRHAESCLANFYSSPIREEILSVPPKDWRPIDSLDSFLLEGVTFYVAPDFAFKDSDEALRIIDWKTGSPRDSDQEQVRGYVLFAMDKWKAEPGEILAELHYLGRGEVDRADVTDAALDAFRQSAIESIEQMRARLTDPVANIAEEERFEPNSAPGACKRCNFRGLCDASAANAA